MIKPPAFLDSGRPDVPDMVVPRGVVPFSLRGGAIRGRLVRLGALSDALLTRHDHHEAVTQLTGQALALVAALASALKYQGSFSLQIKGDGPVGMLLADCTDIGGLRGYARVDAERLQDVLRDEASPSAAALVGDGLLAITVEQGPDTERYQGIVSIEGPGLAEMVMHYFQTSEQFGCAVRLACARTPNGWRAGALMLEMIAAEGGNEPAHDAAAQAEGWRTANLLLATLTDRELLDDDLPSEQLLYRLFHAEDLASDTPRALAYGCRCSRQKITGILETFTPDDLDDMAVDGDIVMTCEFCNCAFSFARSQVSGQTRGLLN
jgi:molecular chaperone Hsp33